MNKNKNEENREIYHKHDVPRILIKKPSQGSYESDEFMIKNKNKNKNDYRNKKEKKKERKNRKENKLKREMKLKKKLDHINQSLLGFPLLAPKKKKKDKMRH